MTNVALSVLLSLFFGLYTLAFNTLAIIYIVNTLQVRTHAHTHTHANTHPHTPTHTFTCAATR
jgi:membrane protein required for beta-lactamase induction